jgi:hypothetical protein
MKTKRAKATAKEPAQTEEPEIITFERDSTVMDASSTLELVSYSPSEKSIQSSQFNNNIIQLISEMPKMIDDDLKRVFTSTNEARRLLFVVNGAASYEIYKRALSRGEEFTTKKGRGVSELFRDLSMQSGLDITTLRDDFRIWDEFGVVLLDYISNYPERILPREFWLLAVKTPNPQSTLQYFEEQRDSVTYYVSHARRDAKKLTAGKTIEQVLREDLEERAEAIIEMSAAAASSQLEAKPMHGEDSPARRDRVVTVGLPETEETAFYIRQIIDKYGSFSGWFLTRAKEEFGGVDD